MRFDLIREGLQEAEARIFIEKVLVDKDKKAALGPLGAEIQTFLDGRVKLMMGVCSPRPRHVKEEYVQAFVNSNWEEMSDRFYGYATKVAGQAE